MSILSWLPGTFKEMLGHVPTLLFDVVSWTALTKDITLLSKRMVSREGYEETKQRLQGHLPVGVQFSAHATPLPQMPEAREMLGSKILSLYFRQLKSQGPMFLDLRPQTFGVEDNKICWHPSPLWAEFSATFKAGVSDLYAGFYGQNEERCRKGLEQTGLIHPSWSEADKEHMAHLFRAHFAGALDRSMSFKLSEFQTSFQKIFAFLMEKKVKLTTDFMLLGIMLVTLYLSLEELGGEYPVANIYNEAQT